MFKVMGVDHIGIAVNDLDEVGKFWTEQLGIPCTGKEVVAEQKVETSFNPTPNGSEIELLAATDPTSPIAKFIEKNGLPFPLIADTDLKLVEAFGVYGEKKMYGRTYMGTYRTTFILNEDGIVERILGPRQIRTKDHAAQILTEDK